MDSLQTGVQTLDRAVSIVEAVAREGSCTLADLVRTTGLSRPTAHRLAVACERHGLLARDAEQRFRLGSRLVAWSARATPALSLAAAAAPVLDQLVALTGESAQCYVREGEHRVCLATAERPSGLRDTVPLGAVMPLTKGSGGKVLLAWAGDRDQFDIDASMLAAVRKRGWAESVSEREAGVASVSAPVWGPDETVIAAVSVSGPAERMGPRPGRRLASEVVAAAKRLVTLR